MWPTRPTINDPRVDDVRILRPQEIPTYLADGLFDLGIAGRDWIEETSAEVVTIGRLEYSKATANPVRIVVAVGADSPWREARDLPQGVRVSTEYPRLTKRYFEGWASMPTSASPTGPPRRRCPTSSTASSS